MVLARYPPSINVTFPDRVETLRGGLQHTMLPVVGHLMHCNTCIPISGTASDVVGIFSATRLRNTVNERRMVTPEIRFSILNNPTCFSVSQNRSSHVEGCCSSTLLVVFFFVFCFIVWPLVVNK